MKLGPETEYLNGVIERAAREVIGYSDLNTDAATWTHHSKNLADDIRRVVAEYLRTQAGE